MYQFKTKKLLNKNLYYLDKKNPTGFEPVSTHRKCIVLTN